MELLNKVKCEKCSKGIPDVLICRYNDLWLCGECLVKHDQKLKELNRKAILEG